MNKLLVATIINTKGLYGEVKLRSYTQDLLSIAKYDLFDDLNTAYKITKAYLYKDIVIATIKDIVTKEQAQNLVNKSLYVDRAALPDLQDNTYYIVDLVGSQVIDEAQKNIGVVLQVFNFGAGDILEVQLDHKNKFLIPFNEETVLNVNANNKEITLKEIYKEYM